MNIYLIYLLVVLGIAIFGGSFVKYSIAGINITYLIMGLTVIYYIKYFCFDIRNNKNELILYDKKRIIDKTRFAVLFFSVYGLLRLVLSYFNITDILVSDRLLIDNKYVFRQGYYLLLFPLLFVVSDYKQCDKIKESVANVRYLLFFLIYLLSIIINGHFSINVPTTFVLAYLGLVRRNRNPFEIFMLILIVFTPISTGGEMTNMLIRAIYVVCYFTENERINDLYKYLRVTIFTFIILCFILPFFYNWFKGIFDANSFWRLNYWYDELNELRKSYYLGVGYGTSFASRDFVAGNIYSGPFAADSQYTSIEKMFVVGSHNSIISTTFRLGIIGGGILLFYLNSLAKKLEYIAKNNKEDSLLYCFLIYSTLIIVSTNVGFETPYYFLIFMFAHMLCLTYIEKSNV